MAEQLCSKEPSQCMCFTIPSLFFWSSLLRNAVYTIEEERVVTEDEAFTKGSTQDKEWCKPGKQYLTQQLITTQKCD